MLSIPIMSGLYGIFCAPQHFEIKVFLLYRTLPGNDSMVLPGTRYPRNPSNSRRAFEKHSLFRYFS